MVVVAITTDAGVASSGSSGAHASNAGASDLRINSYSSVEFPVGPTCSDGDDADDAGDGNGNDDVNISPQLYGRAASGNEENLTTADAMDEDVNDYEMAGSSPDGMPTPWDEEGNEDNETLFPDYALVRATSLIPDADADADGAGADADADAGADVDADADAGGASGNEKETEAEATAVSERQLRRLKDRRRSSYADFATSAAKLEDEGADAGVGEVAGVGAGATGCTVGGSRAPEEGAGETMTLGRRREKKYGMRPVSCKQDEELTRAATVVKPKRKSMSRVNSK
jgi:hypothetical protein